MDKKVFISYSWTSLEHEEWVLGLSSRLVSDGIDVIIDKWDLKEGNDLYEFMESMVKSPDINKVLIILDKSYTEKADSRKGGVGTETQIISPSVYNEVAQEKFIPIIRERDEFGEPYMPTYLKSRVYIDLSFEEHFEKNYEMLLRNIYQRPLYSKPKIGQAPSYLFEATQFSSKTSIILRGFDNILLSHPTRINSTIKDFLQEFFENLKAYKIKFETRSRLEVGRIVCENLNQYNQLRDDLILFIDKLLKSENTFNIEIFIKFLEDLHLLLFPFENDHNGSDTFEFENFKIIIHELFLFIIALGLKNDNFKFIEEFLHSKYFIKNYYDKSIEPKSFTAFYLYTDIINSYYININNMRYISPMADFMIKRLPIFLSKKLFVQADLLCHYIGKLNNLKWFPITYIYEDSAKYDLFPRLESKRYFENFKSLLGVETIDALKDKIRQLENQIPLEGHVGYSGAIESIIPLSSLIKLDKVGTSR